jgi:putative membrane protein
MNAATTPKSANELAEERTDLAVSRTLMAADRTLMAWVRTALSLNSFGFTIYKLLQAVQHGGTQLRAEETPRNIGLFLIGMGTIAMIMGVLEYCATAREMRELKHIRLVRPTFIMGLLMTAFGLTLFFSILTRFL